MTILVPLSETVDIVGGGTPSRSRPEYWGGRIPWATVKDFTSTRLIKTLEFITDEGVANSATNIIPAGTVIVPTRMSLGKAAINSIDLAINQDLKALIPRPGYCGEFLLYFILSKAEYIEARGKGATVKGITLDVLRELPVPNLALAEQERIAGILDTAYGVCLKHEQATRLANEFLSAVFLDMFGDPQTNPKRLPIACIKQLGRVITGNTPPRNKPDYYGEGVDWVKSDNLGSADHFVTRATEQLSVTGRAVSRLVPPGATLVTCIAGSPNSIGNAALADRELSFNQQINAVIPTPEVDPAFLYCQFLVGKNLIQHASTNSMKGMVSKTKFEEVPFLNPPTSDQRRFGRVFAQVIEQVQRLRRATDESKKLFGSLSQRAFTGGL